MSSSITDDIDSLDWLPLLAHLISLTQVIPTIASGYLITHNFMSFSLGTGNVSIMEFYILYTTLTMKLWRKCSNSLHHGCTHQRLSTKLYTIFILQSELLWPRHGKHCLHLGRHSKTELKLGRTEWTEADNGDFLIFFFFFLY